MENEDTPPPFKTARGTRQAKYNYLMWFQQSSWTVMARGLQGSAALFVARASSSAVCRHPFLPTRWREHLTLSRQHRWIKLPVLTGTRRPRICSAVIETSVQIFYSMWCFYSVQTKKDYKSIDIKILPCPLASPRQNKFYMAFDILETGYLTLVSSSSQWRRPFESCLV